MRLEGEFDYIVVHGVFSWVPTNVQDHILALCRANLSPSGVAYISYNAYPGGHLREMLREMLHFHIRGLENSKERITQAIARTNRVARMQRKREQAHHHPLVRLRRVSRQR